MTMVALAERKEKELTIRASDVSGQKRVRFRVSRDLADGSVGDLLTHLVAPLDLQPEVDGRPVSYTARLERDGRQLSPAERVSDALVEEDEVMVAPTIDAG
jgi:hypothetical protein